MRRITYTEGEVLGGNGIMFITDVEPHIEPNGTKRRKASFRCHCNNVFETQIKHVKLGNVISCGCSKKGVFTHGLRHHELYTTWINMKDRCYNENSPNYKYYGERGITVCNEWITSPKEFISYISALPNSGIRGLSLDRIDNNSNYEPGNLRWTDAFVQSRNRRLTYAN